jgi:hypothetical protein
VSEARLLSALATLRDALTPGEALNVPAVLDRSALLDVLSAFTTNDSAPTTVPAPTSPAVAELPRLNAGGYCRECFRTNCTDTQCITTWATRIWRICPICSGSGYEDIDCGPDNACVTCDACISGVVETHALAALR